MKKELEMSCFSPITCTSSALCRCPVFLFREFLRHRPKHMRGIGPLFLALSNFTTDADVWYRPVRLSEATLGSIIRQVSLLLSLKFFF